MPLAQSGNFTNQGGTIMKKVFGLQRHKLLKGDRHGVRGPSCSCGDGLLCDTLRNGSRRYPRNSLDTRVRNHT
jgi:hypothetical protein